MAILLSHHPSIEPPVFVKEQLCFAEQHRMNNYLIIMRLRINRDPLVPGYLKNDAFISVAKIVHELALNRAFSRASSGDPVINYSKFYRCHRHNDSSISMLLPFEFQPRRTDRGESHER